MNEINEKMQLDSRGATYPLTNPTILSYPGLVVHSGIFYVSRIAQHSSSAQALEPLSRPLLQAYRGKRALSRPDRGIMGVPL